MIPNTCSQAAAIACLIRASSGFRSISPRSRLSPRAPRKPLLIRVVREHVGADVADERHRRQAEHPAGDEHGDARRVGERRRDQEAVRDDDELALRAQLEREVVRGRARVERDRLALLDERGRGPRDRLLARRPRSAAAGRTRSRSARAAAAGRRRGRARRGPAARASRGRCGPSPRRRETFAKVPQPKANRATRAAASTSCVRSSCVGSGVRALIAAPLRDDRRESGDHTTRAVRLVNGIATFGSASFRKAIRNRARGCVRLCAMDDDAARSPGSAGSRSRRRRGATATRARASTSSRGRAPRATCGSASPTPRSCTGSPAAARRSRSTSRGTASTTGASCARFAEEQGMRIGAINPNVFGDDVYRLGSLCHPDAGRPRARALDALPRVRRDRGRDRLDRRSASGSPTARTTRARTTSARAARRLTDGPRRALRRAAAGDAPARRVQVLRAGVLQHRPARLGHGRARLPPARAAGAGARRHRPPRARARTSSRSSRCCSPRGCSAASTSTTASTPTTT